MNRTVKILTVLLVAAFSYTMPSHACWWYYIDDMYSYDEDSGNDDCGFNNFGNDDLSWDDNDGSDDLMYGEIADWGSSMEGFVDELIVDGSSNDSFWGSGIFIEQDLGMDDDGSYSGTDSPQQTDSQSDAGQNEYPGEFGNANIGQTGNVKVSKTLLVAGDGTKYWEDSRMRMTMFEMKMAVMCGDVKAVPYLPDKFIKQGYDPDCTARAIATSVWLATGEEAEYYAALERAYSAAFKNDIDIKNDGVELNTEFLKVYSEYFYIEEYKSNAYTSQDIYNNIDNGYCVMGAFWTGDYEYIGPVETPLAKTMHEVTIVGYNANYYYCAYGDNGILTVPREAIEHYPIHIIKGTKY